MLTQLKHGKCLIRYHYRNITHSGKFEIYKRNKTKKKPKNTLEETETKTNKTGLSDSIVFCITFIY